MTYIELINRFWKIDSQVQFTGSETKLYFALLDIANGLHWKQKKLSIPNSRLIDKVQCSKPTFLEARRNLAQFKLITYKHGRNKKIAPIYEIVESEDFVIDFSGKETLPVENFTGKKCCNISTSKPTLIKDKDKDKNKYGGKEKLHDGSTEVFDFFRNNFEDSERIIARLKSEKALGKNFVGFILYLIERGLKNAIIKADSPVKFIMFFAQREREWVAFQMWDSERHKREGDVIDRSRAEDFSHNSV